MVSSVSPETEHTPAKAMTVSRNSPAAVPAGGGKAWLRCQRAVARPGRTTSRRAEPHISDQAPPVWRAPEGAGGWRQGQAGLEIDHSEPQARVWRSRGRAAAHRHTQRPGSTGVEGAWKTRGAKNNMRHHAGPPPTGTSSSLNLQGRVMKPPNPSGGERLHAATYQTVRAGKISRGLVSRRSADPGIRRRTRGRRSPPRPRPSRCLPRSCGAGCRWTLPRRPGTRRGCAS